MSIRTRSVGLDSSKAVAMSVKSMFINISAPISRMFTRRRFLNPPIKFHGQFRASLSFFEPLIRQACFHSPFCVNEVLVRGEYLSAS